MICNYRRPQQIRIAAILILLSILLSACGKATVKVEPTIPPTSVSTSTNTPLPTKTSIPTSTPTLPPTATATPDKAATAAANKTATAVALSEMVKPDLTTYGINPEDGHVAWFNKDSINLEATSYSEEKYYPLNELGKVGDFVLKTNVTWDSTGGLAGCGITFRADEDVKQGGHYSFLMMRLQFQPYWDIEYHKFNEWQATFTVTGKPMSANQLDDEKNSDNDITLIARGENFDLYFNGEKQRTSTNNKLKDGAVSLLSWQDSGKTTCKYSDTWVWVFDKAE